MLTFSYHSNLGHTQINMFPSILSPSTPLLPIPSPFSSSSSSPSSTSNEEDCNGIPVMRKKYMNNNVKPPTPVANDGRLPSYQSLAVLSGHISSVSCLALCGEFVLSASESRDIIVWQRPNLHRFTRFGQGEGSVKAIVAVGIHMFTAHQDGRIRVWKVSRRSENVFRLVSTLPTTKDYLTKFMNQRNYIQTRRHHKKLWIEHADTISCLAVSDGLIYSGSWDKTLKVWRISDLKCMESIKAHDDAINGIAAHDGAVYSASADGKIKSWLKKDVGKVSHCLKAEVKGHNDMSWNAVVVTGEFVYGGGSDGYLMGWQNSGQAEELRLVCDVRAHDMSVLCLCSVGDFVCCGSADMTVSIWKRKGSGGVWKCGVVRGHEGPVKCLQGSTCGDNNSDGFLLYSGGLDKNLRVWWVPTKDEGIIHTVWETNRVADLLAKEGRMSMRNVDFPRLSRLPTIIRKMHSDDIGGVLRIRRR